MICDECNKKKILYENHQVCLNCYKAKSLYKPSGNQAIDDFIKYTLINDSKFAGKMEFVPYDQFKDVKFIAEGGFSKIYKAIWIDGPIKYDFPQPNYAVVLKKLNNSKNITSKKLNEVQYIILLIDLHIR